MEAWLALRPAAPRGERVSPGRRWSGVYASSRTLRGIWERTVESVARRISYRILASRRRQDAAAVEFARIVAAGRPDGTRPLLPYRDSSAYGAFAAQLKQLCRDLRERLRGGRLAKLRHTVRRARRREADTSPRHLAILLGLDPDGRSRTARHFSSRFAASSRRWRRARPLLVFEDLHWADSSLLDLVEMLGARLRELPILVLVLARPELLDARPALGRRAPSYTALPLHPLTEDEARELARAAAEARGRERAPRVRGDAEGNPLFIEQLAAAVRRVDRAHGAVPTTIRGIVTARLDALPPAERTVLLDAAVAGKGVLAWGARAM